MENSHVILKDKGLLCTNCGGKYEFKFPIDLDKMTSKIELFNNLHNDCDKTWEEVKPIQSGIVNEKAMYWLNNGSIGSSYKAIWNYFMGNENFDISHPYDPDDFSRCYKLLEFIPEWKERIEEIGTLSQQWKNLSENWQTLTDMYERNQHENWENSKEIGMHKFMSSLMNLLTYTQIENYVQEKTKNRCYRRQFRKQSQKDRLRKSERSTGES